MKNEHGNFRKILWELWRSINCSTCISEMHSLSWNMWFCPCRFSNLETFSFTWVWQHLYNSSFRWNFVDGYPSIIKTFFLPSWLMVMCNINSIVSKASLGWDHYIFRPPMWHINKIFISVIEHINLDWGVNSMLFLRPLNKNIDLFLFYTSIFKSNQTIIFHRLRHSDCFH